MTKYKIIKSLSEQIFTPRLQGHGSVFVRVSVCVQQNYSDSKERLWEEMTIIVCVFDLFYPAHLQADFTACALLDTAWATLGYFLGHRIHCVTLTRTEPTVHLNIFLSTSILVSLFNSHVVSPFTHTLSLSPWPKPALLL